MKTIVMILAASALVPFAHGQDRIREADRRLRERQEHAMILKHLEDVAHTPEKRREAHLFVAHIGEDFSRLQSANDEMVKPLLDGQALDFRNITRSASEIRKRAGRLKDNLNLPAPEKKAEEHLKTETCTDPKQLQSAVVLLSHAIVSFVTNPIFQQANVIDMRLAIKARSDLERVIELSDIIKQGSERLGKVAQGTH